MKATCIVAEDSAYGFNTSKNIYLKLTANIILMSKYLERSSNFS